jgi:hypothetical protein
MRDLRHGAGFVHEACAQHRVIGVARVQGLDGHFAAQPFVHGQKHAPHAPRSDLAQDLVAGELRGMSGGWRLGQSHGAVDFGEGFKLRPQIVGDLRMFAAEAFDGRGLLARLAVEKIGQRLREQLLFARRGRHYGTPASARKRLRARCSSSAAASRVFPMRAAISAVESPSILASRMASR